VVPEAGELAGGVVPLVATGVELEIPAGAGVEVAPALVAVAGATCGERRTSATVPVNTRPPIDSMSKLTCDPRCTPPTSPSETSAKSRMRRRSPIVKRVGACTEATMVWPTST
jgi:hypothetical protein